MCDYANDKHEEDRQGSNTIRFVQIEMEWKISTLHYSTTLRLHKISQRRRIEPQD